MLFLFRVNDEKSKDQLISLAVMSSFLVLTIQYLILVYFNLLETSLGSLVQMFSKAIVGLFYLVSIKYVLERIPFEFIMAYVISILIFILNFIFFPENRLFMQGLLFPFFFTILPTFLYSYSIDDLEVFKIIVEKISFIVFVVGTVIAFLVFAGDASIGAYSMSLSYYMLLPALVFSNQLFNKINFKSFIYLVISTIVIISLGSRGALLSLSVFVFYRYIFDKQKLNYKEMFLKILVLVMSILFFIFYEQVLTFLYNMLLEFNIRSRTLALFLRNEISLSGRDKLYETIIFEIKKHPFLGLGLAGDRRIIGGYAHNIFLEIWAHFGLIIGSVILISLMIVIYKVLLNNKNLKIVHFMMIWFGMGFIPLLVSSSYITNIKFAIFIGLSINIIQNKLYLYNSEK